MQFTTVDRDNDLYAGGLCCCGGWWFNYCGYARLTGVYGRGLDFNDGFGWKSQYIHIAYVDMKIKKLPV